VSEGNIISFKVFISPKGLLMTEYSKLPNKELSKIFNSEDILFIQKILNKVDPLVKDLHRDLEKELEALN
jgi:hypothetical protein